MQIKVGNKVIMEISDIDKKCLNNDLISIEEWIVSAIIGKINNCKKRLIREWHPKLMADADVTSIPASEEDFINMVTSRPDYKDRVQRDKEMEEEMAKMMEEARRGE